MANRCTVCNRDLAEHLGLIGTCGLLKDCRDLIQSIVDCEVLGQTKRYLTVKVPMETWRELEREVDGHAGHHQAQETT